MTASPREEELALLLTDLTDRIRDGQDVDIETVCRAHPLFSRELRELWGTVMVAEAAGNCSLGETIDDEQAANTSPQLELPCRLGDYELREELGRGGMGVVYRARQLTLNRNVAIKMILRGQLASLADRGRLRAEAEAAARLNHPGIVPVYEVGEIDGQPYFSMKFVAGQTLADRLSQGPIEPRQAARILLAVSRAIHYAHERGVLHRDLKPSNILLDDEGVPHVTDFGLAKQFSETSQLTRTGAILGTPSYMSPEQAAARRATIGPASDIYSLGAILYHTLTGQPPFQASSPVDVLLMLREQDVTPPRLIRADADRDLEMIALRCLQKPIDLRYASAAALADDLQAYLNDEPIAARSGSFTEVMTRMFRETHHAPILENWGVLWMWHSLVVLIACLLTNALHAFGYEDRWYYITLWTVGLGAWAAVFWRLRRRRGPVTFVERQIAHVWAASMIAIGLLFYIEILLEMPVLSLSPVLGLVAGMVFVVKAGILSGSFYIQAAAMFATAFAMAQFPQVSHLLFGIVAATCFFLPGWKYYRQRIVADRSALEH